MLWVAALLALGIAGQGIAPPWLWWAVATTGVVVAVVCRRVAVLSALAALIAIISWGAWLAALDQQPLAGRPPETFPATGVHAGLVVSDPTWRVMVGQPVLQQATVQLQDGSGNVVKTLDLGAQKAGEANFYWDGKDDAGNSIGTQSFQVKVNGASPTTVATWATIAAVQSPADGSSSSLITPLGTYKPTDAIRLG